MLAALWPSCSYETRQSLSFSALMHLVFFISFNVCALFRWIPSLLMLFILCASMIRPNVFFNVLRVLCVICSLLFDVYTWPLFLNGVWGPGGAWDPGAGELWGRRILKYSESQKRMMHYELDVLDKNHSDPHAMGRVITNFQLDPPSRRKVKNRDDYRKLGIRLF